MVIYHRQKADYTCAPVCLKMILHTLGINVTRKKLISLLHTSKKSGTAKEFLPKAIEHFELAYRTKSNGNLKDLAKLQKKGYFVIVLHYLIKEKEGHYAVLKKIDKKYIYLWDPWFGPRTKYLIYDFIKIWQNDPKVDKTKRWYCAIKK